jgi:hypothetical protein
MDVLIMPTVDPVGSVSVVQFSAIDRDVPVPDGPPSHVIVVCACAIPEVARIAAKAAL